MRTDRGQVVRPLARPRLLAAALPLAAVAMRRLNEARSAKSRFRRLVEDAALTPTQRRAAVGTAGSPSGHGETILMVEDEAQVRALTSRILGDRGYSLIQVPNGEAALQQRAHGPEHIDLLVTDVVMPAMSGAELW
jgi:PleD family two-component response regulator